jgi:hypothetical protein
VHQLVNKDFDNIKMHGTTVKHGKTVAMSYHTKQSRFLMRPKVSYRNAGIAYKSDTKFFGTHITENLNWTSCICILRLQLGKVCYIIKSVQGIMGLFLPFKI